MARDKKGETVRRLAAFDDVPTVPPPFDPQGFARESELRLARAPTVCSTAPSGAPARDPRSSGKIPRAVAIDPVTLIPLGGIPYIVVAPTEVTRKLTNHAEAFVVAYVDGILSVTDVIDASGMPREVVLETLSAMIGRGLVALR
jgi:hypothetical protein